MENTELNKIIADIAIKQMQKDNRGCLSPIGVSSLIDQCNARDWCNDYQYSMPMIFKHGITLVQANDCANWWAISPFILAKEKRVSGFDKNPVKAALIVVAKIHGYI